jgi:putative peptidoglycan lipid II flippase
MSQGKKGLLKPTLQITALSFLGIILNFLTQLIAAYYFGASPERDAYFAAMTVPTYIAAVLVGSLGAIFLPQYVDVKTQKGTLAANDFLFNAITLTAIFSAAIVLAGMLFSYPVLAVTTPGYTGSQLQLTAELFVIICPTITFQTVSAISGAALQTVHRFVLPALAPVIASLLSLVCVSTLSKYIGIKSLAYGTLTGQGIACMLTIFALRRSVHFRFKIDWRNQHIYKLVTISAPLLFAGLFYRSTSVFERGIASSLPKGSLSFLGYANQITTILAAVTSSGIAATLYPQLSQAWSEKNMDQLRHLFQKGIRVILLISCPISALFVFWGIPIIRILFERGAFTHEVTLAVSSTLAILTIAFIANSLGGVIAKIYYMSGKTMVGSLLEIICTIIHIVSAYLLAGVFFYKGLAMATSVYGLVSITASFVFLHIVIGGMDMKILAKSVLSIFIAALTPILCLNAITHLIGFDVPSASLFFMVLLGLTYCVGYYYLLNLFKTTEMELIHAKLKLYFSKFIAI